MRFLFGFALVLLLSASVAYTPSRESVLHLKPVMLDRDDPGRSEFGELTLLGAWKLKSNNPLFGGISSMRVTNGHFMALSDFAYAFDFDFDGKRRTVPLLGRALPGIYTSPEPDRDSESMTTDPVSGDVWVGFEYSNAIRRFSPNLGRKEAWVAPPAMKNWPLNSGAEAMARLSDGRFMVFAEESPGPDASTEALLFPGDPITTGNLPIHFYYKPPKGFDPTDAVQLPDGRVMVLNRHFTVIDGVAAAITIVDPREIAPERIVTGHLVAMLKPPLNIDNMEALSIEQQGGRIIVWIASDDNFNPLQQSLLFKFALRSTPVSAAGR